MNTDPTTPRSSVLLVEDEENLLLGLTAIMSRAGYKVHVAKDGKSALQIARDHHPDIIVSDVMMPPPDGFELHSILRKNPETAAIPFLFLTARTAQQDRIHGIEAGADDYITKPFDPRDLVARVHSVLRRQQLGREQGKAKARPEIERLHRKILDTVGLEMQKPVAGLLSILQRVQAERFEKNPKRLAELAEAAADNALRMDSMVKDLVTLVTLEKETTRPCLTSIALDKVFLRAVRRCHNHWTRCEFRDIDLSISTHPLTTVLVADEDLLSRSIFHLVDNACKFGPDGGRVDVSLNSTPDGGCAITVRDQGPGIPQALREKVFEPFFQGFEPHPGMFGGLGLGLAIARMTARAHGGDTVVIDSPSGTAVQLVIPQNLQPTEPS
ncbi:MAG: hybrid sensor histidine kinase/response regulator [Thermoanaerobaculales bacterium]|nr:hybrid sensor histidine kinase/response regulator [Thermoanaerobaculales bacterium]